MEKDKKRLHIHVSGEVQGVFYRESTRQEAEDRGLSGWVRNLPDGRVEAVFEGEPQRLEEMVSWCRRGPRQASVEAVETAEEEARGEAGFRVL
ncbi:acylphosphatase [Rubrobacter indicoceani]|uniref:acylphosphatase n=1 Tax=Rubrobacter indicoceani TaxID=2051957 RepID=UPI000E5BC719|nr:acylphosphatase [Rubrobacter indicoceani]